MRPPNETPPASAPPPRRADDDGPPPPASRGSAGKWFGGVLLALVLYVLSVGPADRLHSAGFLPDQARVIYAPLTWAMEADQSGTTTRCLLWYLRLWAAP